MPPLRNPTRDFLYASEDNRPVFGPSTGGIATAAFKLDSIEQFQRDTKLLGRMTGDSAKAVTVVDSVSATLERVRRATAGLPRPTVFIPTWEKPIIAIGGGSFMSELLEIAGATNVYASVRTPSATVTIEDVVSRNPDFVLVGRDGRARFARWRTGARFPGEERTCWRSTSISRITTLGGAARRAAVALAKVFHPGSVP